MSCIATFSKENQHQSKLLKDLKSHFKGDGEKASFFYNNLLFNQKFERFLDNKGVGNFLTYTNGEPHIEEVLEHMEILKFDNKINKVFAVDNFESTTKEFIEISEGFSYFLMQTLNEKGFTPNDLFESDVNLGVNENNILNVTMQKVIDNIEEYSELEDARRDEIVTALQIYSREFYDSFNNYLDSNLGFTIDAETILSDEIENNDEKVTTDSAFNKSSFEFNTKDGAPKAIKLLIATVPQIEDGMGIPSEMGLPKLVNYNDTFNFIHQQLVETPPDVDKYIAKLKERNRPELNFLIKRLNFGNATYIPTTGSRTAYAREQLLRTQFVNQFNKTHLEFMLHFKDLDGNIIMRSSNIDSIHRTLMSDWASNFDAIRQEHPDLFKNLKSYKAQGKLLEILGIPAGIEVPGEIIDDIYTFGLKSEQALFDIYKPARGEGVLGRFREIAEIYLKTNDAVVDFQHFNVENNIIYSITLNTYLSSTAKELAYYAGNKEALVENFPEIWNDPYSTNSIWKRWMEYNPRTDRAEKIYIGAYEGFKNETEGEGKIASDLRSRDLNLQRIIGVLEEGAFPFLRSADRSTENFIAFKNSKAMLVDSVMEAKREILGYLEDEISVMSKDPLNVAHYDKNNKDFRIFYIKENGSKVSLLNKFNPNIAIAERNALMNLKDEMKPLFQSKIDAEKKIALEKINSIDIYNDPIIDKFVDTLIEQVIEKETLQLADSGVLDYHNGEYVYLQPLVTKHNNIETVVSLFALNSFIANVEQTKILTGDLALFKSPSDVFKRMSMLNSTKESARTDEEVLQYLSSLEWKFSPEGKRQVTNELKTVTFNDVVSNASQFKKGFEEMMTKLFGKDASRYMKVYNKMNEGDAFAYMTYDAYREYSIRFGEWLESDEIMYNKIAEGDMSITKDVIRKATIKKYQYTGKLTNFKDNNIVAGRKFSIIPLLPGMAPKGSVLEKLGQDMIDNGVQMAFYESAAKFGHTVFQNETGKLGAHTMYDAKGNYNADLSNNYDMLSAKYMGNQLKIHNAQKTSITDATQKKKIQLSNAYENGVLKESLVPLVDRYNAIQSQRVKNSYDKKIKYKGDTKLKDKGQPLDDFVSNLLDQGLQQNYTTNELQSIINLRQIPILDISSAKQKVENLTMARLKNNVINSKRSGDSLAQMPDIGLEINQEVADNSERHNLEFYRYAKDGRMLPMEIMLGLPEELRGYVTDKYGKKGVLTQEALDAFNADILADNIIYEETGVMSDLTHVTIYVGFRIPNQDASSSDVAKIKQFMMPHVGGMVVVPKPIVAKTGSDFDIDKMNFYKPNIKLRYKNQYEKAADFLTSTGVTEGAIKTWLKKEYPDTNIDRDSKVLKREFIDEILMINEGELGHPVTKYINSQFNSYLRETGSIVESFSYVKSKRPIGEMKKSELENELLETEIAITLHPDMQKSLLAPLTDNLIKDIVDKIRTLRKDDSANDHISDVFTNAKNVEKFIAFLSGTGGVGQTAVHRTNHVLAQKAGLKMKALHNYFISDNNSKTSSSNRETYSGLITTLKENEVFVFGSNLEGLHGKGGAGVAFGKQQSIAEISRVENGTKGKWAIKGIAEGLMEGNEGSSYALPTVTYPGNKRSRTNQEIVNSVGKLYETARENPNKKFLVAYSTKPGLAGYSVQEMANFFNKEEIPSNIIFEKEFNELVSGLLNSSSFIELGRIENDKGQLISEIISEMITAFVDVAADPYILDINAIQSTTNSILMMLRWGLPLEDTFLFMNQPIIREYVKQQILNESVVSDKSTGKLTKNDLIQKVLKKFDIAIETDNLISVIEDKIIKGDTSIARANKRGEYQTYSTKMLEEGITKGTNQLQALDLFLEYQRQSVIFGEMIRSTSPDTQNFKNFTALEMQVNLRDKVAESEMFENYEEMFNDFIGEYYESKKQYKELVQDLFLAQQPQYKEALDNLKEMAGRVTQGEDNKNRVFNIIESDFVIYSLARTGAISSEKDVIRLFVATQPHTIPKTIKKLRDYFKDNDIDNAFLEEMLTLLNDKREGIDRMKTITKKRSNTQNEILTEAYREFSPEGYEEWVEEEFGHKDFFKDLIKYQILQSGTNNSPFSYMSIIPTDSYFNFVKDGLSQAYHGDVDASKFAAFDNGEIGEFVLHHPEIFLGKFGMPFKVKRNRETKLSTFTPILGPKRFGYEVKQLGQNHKYTLYNRVAEVIPPVQEDTDRQIQESKDPNNPLNNC